MDRSTRYPKEVRERAVRLALEHEREYPSQWAAISSISGKLGMTAGTLRKWVRRADTDQGHRPGLTSTERELLEAPRLGDVQAPVLATPPVVGDLVDAQVLHNVGHLLALTEQDLGLTQLGDDLLGTVALLGYDRTPSSVAKPYPGGGPIPGVRVRAAIECRAV